MIKSRKRVMLVSKNPLIVTKAYLIKYGDKKKKDRDISLKEHFNSNKSPFRKYGDKMNENRDVRFKESFISNKSLFKEI